MSAVPHRLRAFGVLAFGDLANPIGGVAGDRGHGHGGVALAKEPEDLPPTALIRVVRAAIVPLQLSDAQMRLEMAAPSGRMKQSD